MKVKVSKIHIEHTTNKFAYFLPTANEVTFSTMSLYASKEVFDYLIIHELTHYFVHSHRKMF